jgi:hypothetical protein
MLFNYELDRFAGRQKAQVERALSLLKPEHPAELELAHFDGDRDAVNWKREREAIDALGEWLAFFSPTRPRERQPV